MMKRNCAEDLWRVQHTKGLVALVVDHGVLKHSCRVPHTLDQRRLEREQRCMRGLPHVAPLDYAHTAASHEGLVLGRCIVSELPTARNEDKEASTTLRKPSTSEQPKATSTARHHMTKARDGLSGHKS